MNTDRVVPKPPMATTFDQDRLAFEAIGYPSEAARLWVWRCARLAYPVTLALENLTNAMAIGTIANRRRLG